MDFEDVCSKILRGALVFFLTFVLVGVPIAFIVSIIHST